MILRKQCIISLFALVVVSLSTSFKVPSLASVISTRKQWEKNCLSPEAPGGNQTIVAPGDPRMRVKDHCAVYYLHNHKTGGSTLCKTAISNGLKTSGLAENCNIPPKIRHDENIAPEDYVFGKKLKFIAQEDKPFVVNVTFPRFVYMTTMRDPRDRLVSHLHHEFCGLGSSPIQQRLRDRTCAGAPRSLSELLADPCFGSRRMRVITTDYYVSMLTGCANRMFYGSTYAPPANDTCSEDHLEEAKRMLHYFSVILITDTVADFDTYGELLELTFSIACKRQYRSGTHANSDSVVHDLLSHNASSRLVMQMATSLDMQLYKYAKQLAEARLAAAHTPLQALHSFHPAGADSTTAATAEQPRPEKRRLQHAAPPGQAPSMLQRMSDMKLRLSSPSSADSRHSGSDLVSSSRESGRRPSYQEGPLC